MLEYGARFFKIKIQCRFAGHYQNTYNQFSYSPKPPYYYPLIQHCNMYNTISYNDHSFIVYSTALQGSNTSLLPLPVLQSASFHWHSSL